MHNGHGGPGLVQLLKSIVICVAVLIILAPAITQIVSSLLPAVIIIALIVAGLRLLWFYTDRW